MATIFSWEEAQRQREIAACLSCARSLDILAACIEDIARNEDLDCACKTVLPIPLGRHLIGPIESQFLAHFGLLDRVTDGVLPFREAAQCPVEHPL